MKLRTYLLLALLAVLVPGVVFATVMVIRTGRFDQAAVERGYRDTARALSLTVDRALMSSITTLQAMAQSEHLDTGALAAFHAYAVRVVNSQTGWHSMALLDTTGAQLLNTRRAYGSPLPDVPALRRRETFAEALAGRPVVTNLFFGPVAGQPVVAVLVPTIRDGVVRAVLLAAFDPVRFSEILAAQRIPTHVVGMLDDREHVIIARTLERERFVGTSAAGMMADESRRSEEGWFASIGREGQRTYSAYHRSALSGWTVVLVVPAHMVESGLRGSLGLTGGGALALLAIALGLGLTFSRRLARAVSQATIAAEGLGRGEKIETRATTRIAEVAALERALERAGDLLAQRDAARDEAEGTLRAREAALVATVAEFQALFDTAPVGIAIARDRGCRHLEVNRELSRILGKPREGAAPLVIDPVEPQPYSVWEAGHEVPLEQRTMQLAARDGIVTTDRELDIVRGAGPPVKVLSYAVPILDPNGRPRGAVGAFVDVTERRRAEAERDALLTREQDARAAAEAASRAKDEFLAMLSHELRNPLGAIATAIGVLDVAGDRKEPAERARAVIRRQIAHLSRIMDDLLDVGRLTTGKVTLHRKLIDLGETVAAVMNAMRSSGRLDRHEVSVEVAPVWVDADETRMEQVLSNLVGNALKYTPPGGRVAVRVGRNGTSAVLDVADTGVGISSDLIDKVFDLFVQGEGNLDRARGGLGIGLTLVRRLVEHHGGTVDAASDGEGRGSVFTVRLPVVDAPMANVTQETRKAEGARSRPRRVLVVEDNDDTREMLRIALTEMGHEVHEAVDGPNGLEVALTLRPDVVLIDVGLPGLDGYEVVRRLRAQAAGKMMSVFALTGYGQAADRRRAEEAGFDEHLVKPIDPARLASLLAQASD